MFNFAMIVECLGFHLEGTNRSVKEETGGRAADSLHPPVAIGVGADKGTIECPIDKATDSSNQVATVEN